jgi:hypothetical protein
MKPTGINEITAEGSSIGTCFGFSVQSTLPFFYLRKGDGAPLTVQETGEEEGPPASMPVAEWEPTEQFPFSAKLYREEDRFDFWLSHWGWFHVDAAASVITLPPTTSPELREVCLWALPSTVCSLARGDLCLHASCVEVGGMALMFSAPGQYGKTTLAAAFMQAGYRVLAEDKVCCRMVPEPVVLPGPALLRIRPDVYERMDFPGTHVVRSAPSRAYLAFDDHLRGTGDPVPLKAVLFVRPTEGQMAIEPASFHDTLRDLWMLRKQVPMSGNEAFSFGAITELAQRLDAYNLQRPQTLEELPRVVEKVVATCL